MTPNDGAEILTGKTKSKRRMIGCPAIILIIGLLVIILFIYHRRREDTPLSQAWSIVYARYFDQDFSGLDWVGVRRTFEQRPLETPKTTIETYWNSINPMLRLLESSHTYAIAPHDRGRASYSAKSTATMEVLEPSLGRCFGLWITSGRKGISAKVLDIDPAGAGYLAGIRSGWRLIDDLPLTRTTGFIAFLDKTGVRHHLRLKAPADGPNANARFPAQLRRDLLALKNARVRRAQTAALAIKSLGLTVSPGAAASPVSVALVDDRSAGALSGIVEGATVVSLRDGSDKDGLLSASGHFRNPDGSLRRFRGRARCDYASPGPTDILSYIVDRTTYIRFDKFEPQVVERLAARGNFDHSPLILDLRWNTGGSIDEMKLLLEKLLGMPIIVGSRVSVQRQGLSAANRRRIAVLLSPISASAAEVTADALRRYGGAVIVGRRSSGEVEVSRRYPLSDGGAVQVAVHAFFSTTGNRLEGSGVMPDSTVASLVSSTQPLTDATVRVATRLLNNEKSIRSARK